MMTSIGKLLGAFVLFGLLGGCVIMDADKAKDPSISTDPSNTAPKATHPMFPGKVE